MDFLLIKFHVPCGSTTGSFLFISWPLIVISQVPRPRLLICFVLTLLIDLALKWVLPVCSILIARLLVLNFLFLSRKQID